MSETSEAGTEKAKGKGRKGKGAKAKGVRPGLRGWSAANDGAALSRMFAYDDQDKATKSAQRMITMFQKAGRPLELRVEGSSVTLRVDAEGGKVDDTMKKLAKRLAPKDPAKRAARKAARQAAAAPAASE